MKKIEKKIMMSFLTILFLSQDIYALDCEKMASIIGSGQGVDQLNPECINYVKKQSTLSVIMQDQLNKKKIIAFKNIILVEKDDGQNDLIAGKSTGLSDTVSMKAGFINDEVIILDKKGRVMTFNINQVGNIGPLRAFFHSEFAGAKQIFLDHKKQEIIIFNQAQKKVLFFSKWAKSGDKKAKKFSVINKVLKGVSSYEIKEEDGSLSFLNDQGAVIK